MYGQCRHPLLGEQLRRGEGAFIGRVARQPHLGGDGDGRGRDDGPGDSAQRHRVTRQRRAGFLLAYLGRGAAEVNVDQREAGVRDYLRRLGHTTAPGAENLRRDHRRVVVAPGQEAEGIAVTANEALGGYERRDGVGAAERRDGGAERILGVAGQRRERHAPGDLDGADLYRTGVRSLGQF